MTQAGGQSSDTRAFGKHSEAEHSSVLLKGHSFPIRKPGLTIFLTRVVPIVHFLQLFPAIYLFACLLVDVLVWFQGGCEFFFSTTIFPHQSCYLCNCLGKEATAPWACFLKGKLFRQVKCTFLYHRTSFLCLLPLSNICFFWFWNLFLHTQFKTET